MDFLTTSTSQALHRALYLGAQQHKGYLPVSFTCFGEQSEMIATSNLKSSCRSGP